MAKNNGRLTRAAFLAAATHLHEAEAESGALGLGRVWIRELTARQRLDALDAAKERDAEGNVRTGPDGAAQFDDAQFRAYVIIGGLLDSNAGAPVLTIEDVPALVEKGRECLRVVSNAILNLSWLTEADLKSASATPDDGQSDQDESTGAAGNATE